MTAQIRLILLVLVLAYSVTFGLGHARAGAKKRDYAAHWLRAPHRRGGKKHVAAAAAHLTVGDRAVRFARKLVGVPYRWGGDSPSTGFDCSGLVRFVYAHFGVKLPHSSYADFGLGKRVALGSLEPGDLVFFDGVGHVGMYIGGGRFIQSPHSGTDVQVTSLSDPWYRQSYDGARRLVAAPSRKLAAGGRGAARRRVRDPWFLALLDGTSRLRPPFGFGPEA